MNHEGGDKEPPSKADHSLELSLNFSQSLSDPDRVGEDGFLIIVLISGGDRVELVCESTRKRRGHHVSHKARLKVERTRTKGRCVWVDTYRG